MTAPETPLPGSDLPELPIRHSDDIPEDWPPIALPEPLLHLVPDLPEGLDDADDAAVAEFLAAADAASTRRVYAVGWRVFADWCAAKGYPDSPASVITVQRFIAALARRTRDPVTAGTLAVYRAAIGRAHVDAGLPDPTRHPSVAKLLAGIRATRTEAGETENRAPAVGLNDLRCAVDKAHATAYTWRERLAARRDIAVLLLGWANTARRSELARLTKSDLTLAPHHDGEDRLRIRLRGTKTARTKVTHGYVRRGTGEDALYCPWCATLRWLAVIEAADTAAAHERRRRPGHAADPDRVADAVAIAVMQLLDDPAERDAHAHRCGAKWPESRSAGMPVFRPLSRRLGGLPHSPTPITGHGIGGIITSRFAAVGADARGHSLRAGRATWMP